MAGALNGPVAATRNCVSHTVSAVVYPPDLGLLVPRSFCHVLVAVEMTGQSEAMDAIPEIVVDLGL